MRSLRVDSCAQRGKGCRIDRQAQRRSDALSRKQAPSLQQPQVVFVGVARGDIDEIPVFCDRHGRGRRRQFSKGRHHDGTPPGPGRAGKFAFHRWCLNDKDVGMPGSHGEPETLQLQTQPDPEGEAVHRGPPRQEDRFCTKTEVLQRGTNSGGRLPKQKILSFAWASAANQRSESTRPAMVGATRRMVMLLGRSAGRCIRVSSSATMSLSAGTARRTGLSSAAPPPECTLVALMNRRPPASASIPPAGIPSFAMVLLPDGLMAVLLQPAGRTRPRAGPIAPSR